MQWVVLLATLTAEPVLIEHYTSEEMAVNVLSREMQTGSLLFSQGDCLAVKVFTTSPYTHVAAVVVDGSEITVYHSAKGCGVHKETLEEYLHFLGRDRLHVFHPRQDFVGERAQLFQEHLESQLGREYEVKHHLTGERGTGLHCAEYVTDALMAAKLMHANNPPKVSPASLVEGITQSELYIAAKTVEWELPPAPTSDSRCGQLWLDTKHCCNGAWVKCRGWFVCR